MAAKREGGTDREYLLVVERLANDVADAALNEGWLSYLPEGDDASPLQRAVNEMARHLRHVHFEGDGCLEP